MTDETKFKQYMAMICELHDKKLTRMMSDLYWKVLEPYGNDACEKAFKELIYEGKFFPKPADFVEILRGKSEDIATLAWGDVVRAIKRIGPYQSVNFGDKTTHAVIEFMGGWPATGDWPEGELKWKQKEFERMYSLMKIRGSGGEYLPGIHEIQNDASGHGGKDGIVYLGHDKGLKMIA